jgi:hypothetical protein
VNGKTMDFRKPFLWYRHITRGVYYATALNMRSRRTGKPDTTTAMMFTGFLYCGGHVLVAYGLVRFNFPIETAISVLKSIVFFDTYKGAVDLLVVLLFALSFLLAWFCCCYKVTFEEIAIEFNHVKPSHWFRFWATFTVPILGFAAGMYAVSQERQRIGYLDQTLSMPHVVSCFESRIS